MALNNSPLVSILIPAYNSADYISEAIKSAIDQSYTNTEIIVVDDGSTDNTFEIASGFQAKNLQVISQPSLGACEARNKAFLNSRGEYIQYLDADDVLEENKIRLQMEILKNSPPLDIASGSWAHFRTNTTTSPFFPQKVWKSYENPINFLTESWLGGGMMQTACWLTPRKLIEKAGPWNESLIKNPNDDGEFFCRVLVSANSIRFVPNSQTYYRLPVTKNNLSKNCSYRAASSLLQTYIIQEEIVRNIQDNYKTKSACLRNYMNFVYRFYGKYDDLVLTAKNRIDILQLNRQKFLVGGSNFKRLASVVGFYNALKIRESIRPYLGIS